jgi:hypothetical protein
VDVPLIMAINLDEEVRLWTTNSERESIENFSTLYGLIVSLEYLERAYVRDSVSSKESVRSFLNRDSATSRADCQVINLYRIRPDRPQLRTSMYKALSAIQITPQTPPEPARPSLPSTQWGETCWTGRVHETVQDGLSGGSTSVGSGRTGYGGT